MENLKIVSLSTETLKNYMSCFEKNGDAKRENDVKWQFFENGITEQYVSVAIDEQSDDTAAIYATFTSKFKIGDTIELGSQSLDTITDVNYRGKGLFVKLAKEVYQNGTNNNVKLVYGFPNGNSIHGFEKKLQWKVLDPVPFIIKPLKTKYFTDKIKALRFIPNINLSYSKFKNNQKYILKEEPFFSEDIDTIWSKFSINIKVAVNRNKSYLDWRYTQKPNENYKIVNCYSADNKFLGVVVYAVKEKHNGKIAYIMELLFNPNTPKVGDVLLSFAVQSIKKQEADCILSWCMSHSPNYNAYKKEFFLTMPEKFRPIELHFGAKAFQDDLKELIENRENWYLSYSDSDTV